MVSGSDQHGTPVTVRAEKEGTPVEQVAERFHQINSKAIKDLAINFDLFTKTHNPNHFEVVHDVFMKLLENGFLYKKGTMQYYCSKCNKFLPDRYVEGVCNKCGNEHAEEINARSAAPPSRLAIWGMPYAPPAGPIPSSGRRSTSSCG